MSSCRATNAKAELLEVELDVRGRPPEVLVFPQREAPAVATFKPLTTPAQWVTLGEQRFKRTDEGVEFPLYREVVERADAKEDRTGLTLENGFTYGAPTK